MHIDEIAVGGSIEIEVVLTGKALNFKSEVVLIKHHSILINSIKFNDQTVGFSDKYKINFLYKHEGKLYKWENVSIKLVRYDGGIYHKIDLAGEGQPYNRREYFRLYIGEEMPIYINTASGATALSVLVKDISESGVGFITKEDIDVDRTIRLKLKSNNSIISLSGVIVRKEYLENIKSNLYGCKFYEKNNALGKYIAKRQNELIKKRLSSPATKANMSRVNKTGADKKLQAKNDIFEED